MFKLYRVGNNTPKLRFFNEIPCILFNFFYYTSNFQLFLYYSRLKSAVLSTQNSEQNQFNIPILNFDAT